jgi:hypothetical protein
MKRKDGRSSTLDEDVYDDIIDKEDTKTKRQSSCLDSLQPGNSNNTIRISQSHPFSYCNVPNMSKTIPDHVVVCHQFVHQRAVQRIDLYSECADTLLSPELTVNLCRKENL